MVCFMYHSFFGRNPPRSALFQPFGRFLVLCAEKNKVKPEVY